MANKDRLNEAAWNLSNAVREANQAIANSAVAAQERNMKFAQSTFENGVEVLKSHAESTRAMMDELVQEPSKDRAIFQSVADNAVAAQERNVRFAQSLVQNGTEVLKSHAEDTRALMQTLAEQSQKQQEAFQVLVRESMDAYLDYFYAPFSYYEQTLETAGSIARQGVETAQKIARQGMEAVQRATRQTVQSATE
jgi:hypothetical protein